MKAQKVQCIHKERNKTKEKKKNVNLLSMFDRIHSGSGEFLFAQVACRTSEQSCPNLTLLLQASQPDSEAPATPFQSKSNTSSSS